MDKLKYKLLLLLIMITMLSPQALSSTPNGADKNIIFIKGSNIYLRTFLFFFPLGRDYQTNFHVEKGKFNTEVKIKREDIINEPADTPFFETDLLFRIKDIPLNQNGQFVLPVTIRCNRKVTLKEIRFTVVSIENIVILKAKLDDIMIEELSGAGQFEKRNKWKYPFYFDLRLQLPDELVGL